MPNIICQKGGVRRHQALPLLLRGAKPLRAEAFPPCAGSFSINQAPGVHWVERLRRDICNFFGFFEVLRLLLPLPLAFQISPIEHLCTALQEAADNCCWLDSAICYWCNTTTSSLGREACTWGTSLSGRGCSASVGRARGLPHPFSEYRPVLTHFGASLRRHRSAADERGEEEYRQGTRAGTAAPLLGRQMVWGGGRSMKKLSGKAGMRTAAVTFWFSSSFCHLVILIEFWHSTCFEFEYNLYLWLGCGIDVSVLVVLHLTLKSVGFFILVPKTREDVSTLNGIYVTDKDSVWELRFIR